MHIPANYLSLRKIVIELCKGTTIIMLKSFKINTSVFKEVYEMENKFPTQNLNGVLLT